MKTFLNEITLSALEVPGEIALVIPITGCTKKCPGCHSPHYWNKHLGEHLSQRLIHQLVQRYKEKASCICFMGGDEDTHLLHTTNLFRQAGWTGCFALYSGFDQPEELDTIHGPEWRSTFSYLKLGRYIAARGGLASKTTNQRMIYIPVMTDITKQFQQQ